LTVFHCAVCKRCTFQYFRMSDSGIQYRPKHVSLYHLDMCYRYCCNRLLSCIYCCSFVTARYPTCSKMIQLCLTLLRMSDEHVRWSGDISPFFLSLSPNFKSLPSRSDRFIFRGNSVCYTFCRTLGGPRSISEHRGDKQRHYLTGNRTTVFEIAVPR
jgi:hypothetical protein